MIEEYGKKQLKIIENSCLNLMNLLKKVLILTEIVYNLMNKKIFNRLTEEISYEFQNC